MKTNCIKSVDSAYLSRAGGKYEPIDTFSIDCPGSATVRVNDQIIQANEATPVKIVLKYLHPVAIESENAQIIISGQ